MATRKSELKKRNRKSRIIDLLIWAFHHSFNCFLVGRLLSSFSIFSLSTTKRNRSLKGIFPKSYVHLIADVEIVKNDYVIKRCEIVDEITTILKEWHEDFKRFFLVSLLLLLLFLVDIILIEKLSFHIKKTDTRSKSQDDSRENVGAD